MKRVLEWVAALLVVQGVVFIAWSPHLMVWLGGIVLLTFGVRLAIDCGKRHG